MIDLGALAEDAMGRHRSTPDLVANVLRQAILHGLLKSGQALPQDEVATQFGLSRIPVREALRQLEGEGLITFYPNRGAVVSRLSAAELREICDMRIALETLALRLAIPHLTEDVLRQAETILDETDEESDPTAHWTENNWKFHSTLYAPAQRPVLLKTLKTLHNNVARYLRLHLTLMHYKAKGQEEHRQILDACRRGDSEAAQRLLEQHIGDVAKLLEHFLAQDGAEG